MERIEVAEIIVGYGDAVQDSANLFKEQVKLTEQLRKLRAENRELNKEIKEVQKDENLSLTQRNQKTQQLTKEVVNNKNAIKQLSAEQRDVNKAFAANTGDSAYKKLTTQLNKASKEIKDLRAEGKKVPKDLSDNFRDLNERVLEIDESVGDFRRNVGNYKSAFDGFSDNVKAGFQEFVSGLENTDGALGQTTRGVGGLSKGFKALLANPVVALFAGLAAILGTVFTLFAKTERGASLLAKGTAVFQGIMSSLVGIVDSAATAFVEFTENPVQGIQDLGKALLENITNRFRAIINLGGAVGDVLKGVFSLDSDQLAKGLDKAKIAGIQLASGLDANQQEDFATAIKETTKEAVDNAKAFADLEQTRRDLRKQNRELIKEFEELITVQETQQAIADDATKSFAIRETAAESARKAIEAASAKEIELAKNNLSVLNTEIALRQRNGEEIEDLRDQQTDALTTVIQAERNLTLAIADNEKTRSELKQDRLERDLDILLDGFDNQKSINERLIDNDRATIKERQSLLEETVQLSNDSFAKQIETIQQFTGVAVNANDLLQESDAVALNERIRSLGLSEIIEGRLLEVIRDRRTAVQDLEDAQQTLNEASQQQQIVNIQTNRNNQFADLFNNASLTQEQIAAKQLEIQMKTERDILNTQIQFASITADERAKLEAELAKLNFQERQSFDEKALESALNAIELEKIARKKAILEGVTDEKERARQLEQVENESSLKIVQARLMIEQLSATERANLELELIQLKESEAIASENRISQKRKENIDKFQEGADIVSSVFSSVQSLRQAETNRELSELEANYARRIELAEGNSEEQEGLEMELAERREALEREAFERNKRAQIAQALIAGAVAFVQSLPNYFLAAATALSTIAQIAVISRQQFHDGGIVGQSGQHASDNQLKPNEEYAKVLKDEMWIVPKATRDKKTYTITGTPKQIASQLNSQAGGKPFALGADVGSPTIANYIPTVPVFKRDGNRYQNNIITPLSDKDIGRISDAVRSGMIDAAPFMKPVFPISKIEKSKNRLNKLEKRGNK